MARTDELESPGETPQGRTGDDELDEGPGQTPQGRADDEAEDGDTADDG